MIIIKNTSLDRTKAFLHRKASKLVMEPMLFGQRLRLRSTMKVDVVPNEYQQALLDKLVQQGTIEVSSDAVVAPVEKKDPEKKDPKSEEPSQTAADEQGPGAGESTTDEVTKKISLEDLAQMAEDSTKVDEDDKSQEGQPSKKGRKKHQ